MSSEALPSLDDLLAATAPLVLKSPFGTGAIVGVLEQGRISVESLGIGLRGPMRVDGVVELHCAAKPLVAFALASGGAPPGIGLRSPVMGLIPEAGRLGEDLNVVSLVNHGARLPRPAALHWVATPPIRRPGIGDLHRGPVGAATYSEVASGLLLSAIIEKLRGVPASAALDRLTFDPLGISGDISLSARSIGQRQRLEPVFGGLPVDPLPMLHPLHPSYVARQDPAFGGYATAAAYLTVLRAAIPFLSTISAGGTANEEGDLAGLLRIARGYEFDHVLKRPVDFRGGFLIAGPSWRAGLLLAITSIANLVVAVLPEHGWAAFVFLNGIVGSREDAAFTRRTVLAALRAGP